MDYEPAIGDLVWARMKSFPPWPARVVKLNPNAKKQPKKGTHWVYFFGTNNSGWVDGHQIKPYEDFKAEFTAAFKSADFKKSVADIDDYIVQAKEAGGDSVEFFEKFVAEKNKVVEPRLTPGPAPKPKRQATPKRQSDTPKNTTSAKKSRRLTSPSNEENGTTTEEVYEEEILNLPPVLNKPESPDLSLNKITNNEPNKPIAASKDTFGFLGLGNMGSSLVMNLINSGHRVNLWSRNEDKCLEVKKQADINNLLVETYKTPRDVVQNSDIIFSCLSDAKATKAILTGNCGVIDKCDDLENKGYVELCSINPEDSKDFCGFITKINGRYLEAQMQGSKKQAEEGNLIILAAGDESLFAACRTPFEAIGQTAFYLGNVGFACKMNLCVNMTLGIGLVGLAESLVLAEKCGLSGKDFLEIFNLSEGSSKYLKHKGQLIHDRQFSKVEQALEYMQKDLKLCLDISNDVKQNIPVAAIANEAYKTARRSGYDQHDVSIVFMKMRH